MRVAVDVTPLIGPRTGVGAFVAGLLRSLPSADTDVRAFALTARGRRSLRDAVPPSVRIVHRPVPARAARAGWLRGGWPPAALVSGRCDVVHGTNYVVPPGRRAAEVVTVHDLSFVHFPQFSQRDTLDFKSLLLSAVKRGAFIHTHTRFVAEEVREWLVLPAERVVAVPGGIPGIAAIRGALPGRGRILAGSDRYVLALGTEEPRKDLPTLVRAFDSLAGAVPGVTLLLAGPRGWGSDDVDAAIASCSHPDRVRRLGWVGIDDRNSLLRDASVLAYPSVYEGFGYPALEALAAGVPVVATTAGSLPEVLGGVARLVDPGDSDALAAALIDELSGRGDVSTEARLARAARYSWDGLGAGLRDLYRRAVTDRRAR